MYEYQYIVGDFYESRFSHFGIFGYPRVGTFGYPRVTRGGGVFLVDFLSYTTTLIIPETPTRIHVRKSYIENNWELDNICNNLYSWNIFQR